jgi:hypothetical protein
MPWGKVDDRLHRHRKVRKSGVEAMGVWVLAHSFCSDQGTSGRIARDEVIGCVQWADGAIAPSGDHVRTADRAIERLLTSGLWEELAPGEYVFHDWEIYLPGGDKSAGRQEKARKAARARWDRADAPEHCSEHAEHDARSSATRARSRPVPSRPVPVDPDGSAEQPQVGKRKGGGSKPAPSARPEAWTPSDAHFERGRTLGFDETDVENMAEAFTAHHDSKGSRFVDWDAAFRTWLQNQARFDRDKGVDRQPLPPPVPRKPPPPLPTHEETMAQLELGTRVLKARQQKIPPPEPEET